MADREIVINIDNPPLTLAMLEAGAEAYKRWDEDKEEVASLVASIYLSMLEALWPDKELRD